MKQKELQLVMIRGLITNLPEDKQAEIKKHAETLRVFLKDGGETAGIAFALVGSEVSAED